MSKQTKFPKYNLLGVEVDAVTRDQALDYIRSLAQSRRASYVVKPYVEFLDAASRRPDLSSILNQADLCLPDGIALLWGAHYLYRGPHRLGRVITTGTRLMSDPTQAKDPLPERFGGVSFTWPLLEMCQQAGLKVYLIGSPRHGSIQQTSQFLSDRLPELRIVGQFSGHLDGKLPVLMQQLDSLRPDVILIGMGFPRQEILMSQLKRRLKHGVMIGEGGSFDYRELGGRARRAPVAIQNIGLEWLWRLMLQPARWRRQLAVPRFVYKIYRQGRHG